MKKMSICIISDTHNKHKQLTKFYDDGKLPEADVIIHCGDISSIGKEHEIRNFVKWFSGLEQFKHKIFIAGNHDKMFEYNGIMARQLIPKNIIYLQDNGVEIDGIKFWGTPVQPIFHNWAFNRSEEKLAQHWSFIPDDTDVLITHGPPNSIMDWSIYDKINTGSPSLYHEIMNRIKPIMNVMGHIHYCYGVKNINEITFINASNLDEAYECVNPPIYIELFDNNVKVLTNN
jgi:Icc-related predicted phosphoesterase